MAGLSLIRIAGVALALSTLSFAAGVAGDLSIIDPPRFGQRVVLRLPPEIQSDAPRAAPLAFTANAAAAGMGARDSVELVQVSEKPAPRPALTVVQPKHKPSPEQVWLTVKPIPVRAVKGDGRKAA